MSLLDQFDHVWACDFEFQAQDGFRPCPLCMVAIELRSGCRIVLWADALSAHRHPPFDVGPRSLFVAYYASADMGCFLQLGWAMPVYVLDLYAEFRCMTNGFPLPCGSGLLGALVASGLDGMSAIQKEANRELVMRGGPYTAEERDRILRYCADDVDATLRLLQAMEPALQPQALIRGRYMRSAAKMEEAGVPIDTVTLARLRERWPCIQDDLITQVDADYGVFDGRSFIEARFARWLYDHHIQWPVLDSGSLALDDDTFGDMCKSHPEVMQLRELRASLSLMRLIRLAVGPDGRNRTLLSAFASSTGRNQPSTTRFIFGPATWLRGLILPGPEMAIAYVDYAQQEFGIAAALSGDNAMKDAYLSGDPYLGFAKRAGAAPADATRKSHGRVREQFKVTTLGVQYGMTEYGLAIQLGVSPVEARYLLQLHRRAFPVYWAWNDAVSNYGMLYSRLHTVFGWTLHVTAGTKPRSLRNFPMQANGAEILRMACCLATERGITVCAPVHDALLVEGPADCIEDVVAETQACMQEAGKIVLSGFPLSSDAKIIRYPDRYMDPRGVKMWSTVMSILDSQPGTADPQQPCEGSPSSPATPA